MVRSRPCTGGDINDQLGANDRHRVDEYLTSIREIERAPNDVLDYLRKLFSADKT